ncbi:uncharacterized protein LOC116199692 isoform X2 [Punica granatum]|uniref:Uncharacterized protein LOC116199692 isoform X2 n=1 Tax=Punica granatum TaxID=22663 RepID=A0A6P8CNX1_PUNGR|nr:uncharacterized protein LOC116199692 isoform X2 [Punica granatum]
MPVPGWTEERNSMVFTAVHIITFSVPSVGARKSEMAKDRIFRVSCILAVMFLSINSIVYSSQDVDQCGIEPYFAPCIPGRTGCPHGKYCWPELYGTSGEKALAVIKRENPMVMASIVKVGTAVIMDYCCDRVWVLVNNSGVVIRVPTIG